MTCNHFRRVLALALALALAAVPAMVATPAWASDNARFSGRVFAADGVTPQRDVVVTLVDPSTERIYRAEATDDLGTFTLETAPAGAYELLIDTGGGAFLAAEPLQLSAGSNRPLALTLNAAPQDDSGSGSTAAKTGLSWRSKWIIAGSIIAAGLFVIYDASEDEDENPASDF